MKTNSITVIIVSVLALVLTYFLVEYPKVQTTTSGLLHIYFLDVGQGDSELIELPSKKIILIDGGPHKSLSPIISSKVPLTINKIDLLIISHSHADHIDGLEDVLNNYQIGCVIYDWQDKSISATETNLRNLLTTKQIHVITTLDMSADKRIPADCFSDANVEMTVYSLRNIGKADEADIKASQNLESNIVELKYGDFESLFTGDAELPVQTTILPFLTGDIEILKVAHHGSRNGYYAPLIEKLRPDYAIISAGEGNSYGHPHKETLDGYATFGLKYARTDLNGTIEVDTDGSKWSATLEKP